MKWTAYQVLERHDTDVEIDLNGLAALSGWCIRDIQRLLWERKQ